MLVCHFCRAKIPEVARFCSKCGTPITATATLRSRPSSGSVRQATRKTSSQLSVASIKDALKDYLDPNPIKRSKAKDMLEKSRNLHIDAGQTLLEAYETYLNGESDKATELFLVAARTTIEAGRLSKEAESIIRDFGDDFRSEFD